MVAFIGSAKGTKNVLSPSKASNAQHGAAISCCQKSPLWPLVLRHNPEQFSTILVSIEENSVRMGLQQRAKQGPP